MALLDKPRAMRTLRKTPAIMQTILRGVDQARALGATDGPDGWSVLEVLCHLNDYEQIFGDRIRRMIAEDNPHFTNVDHEALVEENHYKEQMLDTIWKQYIEKRRALVVFLDSLPAEAWQRPGVYHGGIATNVTEVAINIALHEINHMEQITRSLGLSEELI